MVDHMAVCYIPFNANLHNLNVKGNLQASCNGIILHLPIRRRNLLYSPFVHNLWGYLAYEPVAKACIVPALLIYPHLFRCKNGRNALCHTISEFPLFFASSSDVRYVQ